MDTLDAIFTRRSIRKYKPDSISNEATELIVKAGMYAPTARNTQSNHFVVVTNRLVLDEITTVHPYAKMLKEAPLAIVICGDKSLEKEENYLVINGSAATQNVLLAVHSLSMGGVWLGVYGRTDRMEGISKLLKLPEHIVPISVVAVGISNEIKEMADRFDRTKLHLNAW